MAELAVLAMGPGRDAEPEDEDAAAEPVQAQQTAAAGETTPDDDDAGERRFADARARLFFRLYGRSGQDYTRPCVLLFFSPRVCGSRKDDAACVCVVVFFFC